MRKLKLLMQLTCATLLFISCTQETLNSTDEIEPNAKQTETALKRATKNGWQCSPSIGPIYHFDLYNEGVAVSDQCRYLHIYDPNSEDDNGEFLHIGYWAIAPNATTVFNVGLDGLQSCNFSIPNKDCSLLEDNTQYYYELSYSTTGYPLISGSSYGYISPYIGECECD